MGDIEHWWITTGHDGRGFLAYDNPDDAHAALGKHEESERVVEVVPLANARGAVNALREIAEADPVDLALDPTWTQRIARAELGVRPFNHPGGQ